jgi:hypothetical protein
MQGKEHRRSTSRRLRGYVDASTVVPDPVRVDVFLPM